MSKLKTKVKDYVCRPENLPYMRLLVGYHVYQSIRKKYNSKNKLYIFPFCGLGDVYLVCQHIEEKEYCTAVLISTNATRITKLFQIESNEVINTFRMSCLCYYVNIIGLDKCNAQIMHYDAYEYLHIGVLMNMRGVNGVNYDDMLYSFLFGDASAKKFVAPKFIQDEVDVVAFCDSVGIEKDKSIIIAPDANSMSSLPVETWNKIVAVFLNKGYRVFTNCPPGVEPLVNTKAVDIPFEKSVPILNYAGNFIGLRSGFCDLICSSTCRKFIIYEPTARWGITDNQGYFGLRDMGIMQTGIDYTFDINNFDDCVEKVKEYFN
ncbi:hypothetical protein [Anaerosporobacter faecicola]|uniref:hypothetical protein n=1 Tax=Anaerosporobacter faecicola TaxID=2718714 RepID=UPI00143BF3A8|nr:hypothetical protein [Anaerosporobacter faecicola]